MKKQRKVILAIDDAELRAAAEGLGRDLGNVQFETASPGALNKLNGTALSSSALVVEIDARSPQSVAEFQSFATGLADRKVIAAARNADSNDVRRLFRAGAADVVVAPFTAKALADALSELLSLADPAGRRNGKVVSIIKAGGGVGGTTVALNLAAATALGDRDKRRAPIKAAVLDLDLQFGSSDLALNLKPRSTLMDVLLEASRFDARFLEAVLTEHSSGLMLLPPAPSLTPLDALSPAFTVELIDQSARLHGLTVLDLPGAWTDWTFASVARSDLILLVVAPTVTGVMGARRALDALAAAHVQVPTFLAVNKLGGMVDALDKPERISRALDLKVEIALPLDAAAGRAADRGALIVEKHPHTKLGRGLKTMASKVHQRLAEHSPRNAPVLAGVAT